MYLKLLQSEKHPLTPEELNPPQPQQECAKKVEAKPETEADAPAKPKSRRRRHRHRRPKKAQEAPAANG